MSKKLGYTWYSGDWNSSKRVARLNLFERGLYREFIDMAMANGNRILYELDIWAHIFWCKEKEIAKAVEKLKSICDESGTPLLQQEGNVLSIPSCEKRIERSKQNSLNGSNGGAPRGNTNAKKDEEKTTEIQPNMEIETTEKQAQYNTIQYNSIQETSNENKQPPIADLSESNLYRKPVIPSYEQVWEYFARSGGTEEMARKFYDKNDGLGWFYNNTPITNWCKFASNFINNWKDNEKSNKPTTIDFDKIIQRQRDKLAQHG